MSPERQKELRDISENLNFDLLIRIEQALNYIKLLEDRISKSNLKGAKLHHELKNIKRKSQWISVDDRLPEDCDSVIIHSNEGGVSSGFYSVGCSCWIHSSWDEPVTVTHWMPPPGPPK